jgi:uncharacterized protein
MFLLRMGVNPVSLTIEHGGVDVAAELLAPDGADWLLLLAHGAGAGMRHRFMVAVAEALAARNIASLRYEYPYMSAGRRRPDPAPALEAVTRRVAEWAAGQYTGLRLAAGGKSMGGRMTSRAQAEAPLPRVEKLVFLGFPLHPAGKPGTSRADHLDAVRLPMLFLQGERDALAELPLIRDVCARLGPRATLHEVAAADHGFDVLKPSGRTADEVLAEVCGAVAVFLRGGASAR